MTYTYQLTDDHAAYLCDSSLESKKDGSLSKEGWRYWGQTHTNADATHALTSL